MRRKSKSLFLLLVMALSVVIGGCGQSKEEKEKEEVRNLAQAYFDALRVDDQEKIYDCYLPVEKQRRDAGNGLLGFASQLLFKVDISGALSDLNTLFGGENSFAKYKYRAGDVKLDEDWMDAVAYVGAFEDGELKGSLQVDLTKYDGKWYVIKGTIADDSRDPAEIQYGSVDEGQNPQNRNWIIYLLIALGAVVVIASIVIITVKIRNGKSKTTIQFEPLGGGGLSDPGDILCPVCGTVNPVGIRTCMGCGKKFKKRRR